MPRGCRPRSTPTTLKASNRTARGANPGYRDDQKMSTLKGLNSILAVQAACHASPVSQSSMSEPQAARARCRRTDDFARHPGMLHSREAYFSDLFDALRPGAERYHAVQSIDLLVTAMPRGCRPRSTPTTLKASNRTARGANPGYRDDQKVSTLKGLNSILAVQAACHASPVSQSSLSEPQAARAR